MDPGPAHRLLTVFDATVDRVWGHLCRRLGRDPADELVVAVYLAVARLDGTRPDDRDTAADPSPTGVPPIGPDDAEALDAVADRVVAEREPGTRDRPLEPDPTPAPGPDPDTRARIRRLLGAALASEITSPKAADPSCTRGPVAAWPLDAPLPTPPPPADTRRGLVLGLAVVAGLVTVSALLAATGVTDTEPLASPPPEPAPTGPPAAPAPRVEISHGRDLADGQRLGIAVDPPLPATVAICVRGASDLCAPLRVVDTSDPASLDFVRAVSVPRRFIVPPGELVDCALMSCDLHVTPAGSGTTVFPLTFDPASAIAGPIRALASPPPPWHDGQQVVFDFAELAWLTARQCAVGTNDCWTDQITGLPANSSPPGPGTSAAIRVVRHLPLDDGVVDCLATACEIRIASIYFPRPVHPVPVTIDPTPDGINGLQVLVGPTAPLEEGQGVSIIARRATGDRLTVELCHGSPEVSCQHLATVAVGDTTTVVARVEPPRFTDDDVDCAHEACVLRLLTDTQQVVVGIAFEP